MVSFSQFHRDADGIVEWLNKKTGPQWTEVDSKVKKKKSPFLSSSLEDSKKKVLEKKYTF